MKKVFNVIIILFILLLGTNIVLFLVNGSVNYKELNQDITSIKKTGKIINAKSKKDKNQYDGTGYYILVTNKKSKTTYSLYINNKSIWEYDKTKKAS